MYYLLLSAISAATAAMTTTITTIPAINAVEITGLVTVTVDTAVVVTVLVTVLVTVEVTVDVVTAVVVTVEVVVVVTGVYGTWKYEATQACSCGSGFGMPMNTAYSCQYGLVQSEPLIIASAKGGTTPGGAKAPMNSHVLKPG